ncbi:MAG: hypothetical protein GTO45_03590 [Candidatus Aminicenantes bacterium]|nr:hypothetical protein [Candidatus Aminicenantes bacterium]NIM77809.1 hypothetical protein [Candidatus Aminicenantes bacterium]NIN17122.1 hypothetical protein [Candidatus Aminicenantes bacterium]NIN41015.1 hypothetical protein [Candidatus Aminicenantes bacterium]NIN83820.1 hypothetical protein [Candidatus Aminicenantes bacterium]
MIDSQDLLDRIAVLLKLPIEDLKWAIFHKVRELEDMFKAEIDQYRRIKNMIEPGKDTAVVETIPFKLTREGKKWVPSVRIPGEIVDYIAKNAKSGIISMMPKIEIDGKTVDISCENTGNEITGTITEKVKEEVPRIPTPNGTPVKYGMEDLKMFLNYMVENKRFFHTTLDVFYRKWKPSIDRGYFATAT